MNIQKLLFCTSLSIFITHFNAQILKTDLETVTVTSNFKEEKIKSTSRNIIIIDKQQIAEMNARSVDEVLRFTPGVEVQMRGVQGSQSNFLMRGGTFQQVLVLLDGVRLNDPLTGHFSAYIPVQVGEIERIEVLKGAASTIYGSDAVGGVIHIITQSKHNKKVTVDAGTILGEFGLRNANALLKFKANKHNFTFGVVTNNADGQQLRGTKGFFNLHTATFRHSIELPNNWNITSRAFFDYRSFNAQNFYTTFRSDTSKERVKSSNFIITAQKKWDKLSWRNDINYKKLNDSFLFNPRSIANNNNSGLINIQSVFNYDFNKNNDAVFGVQFINRSIKSNDRGNHSLNHTAFFIQLQHKIGKYFTLQEGARLAIDERYGSVVVPQISANFSKNKFTLRGMAGSAIRDADFTERFNNYGKPLVTGGSIGNPDLRTETSINTEIGAQYAISNNLILSTSVFKKWYDNLIDWKSTPYAQMPRKVNLSPTGTYALASNISEITTTGFEFDVQYRKNLNRNFAIDGLLGILHLKSKNNDPVPSFYISGHAKWQVNGVVAAKYKNLTITNQAVYRKRNARVATNINAQIRPEYLVHSIKIMYDVPKYKSQFFVAVDNTGDQTYQDILGAKLPRRWLSGGFNIGFGK